MAEQSFHSVSPPLNLPPFPPASLSSLPSEVLVLILNNIPSHPSKHRSASLAKICLVNNFFLSIARPLLYREIHLDFEKDGDQSWSGTRQPYQTLREVEHCSVLVKVIRIVIAEVTVVKAVALACLFSRLKSLETVETIGTSDGEDNMTVAIGNYQPGLKHLELRGLHLVNHWPMLRTMKELETLVGHFDSLEDVKPASHQVDLACRLHRFVSHSSIATSTFDRILHSSSISLTSLAFWIEPDHADFDLRRFKNLKALRISIFDAGDHHYDEDLDRFVLPGGNRMEEITVFASQIRRTLESTLSLPLETFSITGIDPHCAPTMALYPILTFLPPSIRHFGTVPDFLEPDTVNYREIVTAVRQGRLPHLSKITVFPSDDYDCGEFPDAPTRRRMKDVEKELGVPVTWHRAAPGLVTQWCTLEPYVEAVERAKARKAEEDSGSEEEDEFRSDTEEDEDDFGGWGGI